MPSVYNFEPPPLEEEKSIVWVRHFQPTSPFSHTSAKVSLVLQVTAQVFTKATSRIFQNSYWFIMLDSQVNCVVTCSFNCLIFIRSARLNNIFFFLFLLYLKRSTSSIPPPHAVPHLSAQDSKINESLSILETLSSYEPSIGMDKLSSPKQSVHYCFQGQCRGLMLRSTKIKWKTSLCNPKKHDHISLQHRKMTSID